MHVTLAGNLLQTLSDGEILLALARFYQGSRVPSPPDFILTKMLARYRQYMKDGMGDSWVVNEMKAKRVQVTDGAYVLSDMQIAAFVSTMKSLKGGILPPDPNETPSWAEAYGMSPLSQIPWGTLALIAGGAMLAYGFATGLGKGLVSR